MNSALAFKAAERGKAIKAEAIKRRDEQAEAARRQREWDNFMPMVYGQPCPGTTIEEMNETYERARRAHQNIFYGGHCPELMPEVQLRPTNFIDSVLSFIGL